MTKREVMRLVFGGQRPPYVPWHCQFTREPWDLLVAHFGGADAAEAAVDNHIRELGSAIGFFEALGHNRFRMFYIGFGLCERSVACIEE
ncbi:MAG: hypothetical protein NTV49_13455 [Kiritimatiellaeota bacterium]|nr:hypothetical protein [Kiritimatiellota bacterium]